MKLTRTLLAASLLASAAAFAVPAQAQSLAAPVVAHPDPESLFTSDDPVLHRNKQATLHIVRELLQCNQWDRAGEWLTDRYIQHNPLAASGLDAVIYYFTQVAKRQPTENCGKLTNPIVAVQAEGDYVTVLYVNEQPTPGRPGETYTTTWFDTWRFVDGKADEHWDPATLPQPRPPMGSRQDEIAIETLMWDYVRAIDSWNPDAYADVFTPDGAFGQVQGRDALRKMVADMKADRAKRNPPAPELQHIMSNQTVTFTGPDSATVNYYWMTVTKGVPSGPRPDVLAAGRGVDEVVRLNGRWLIKSRNVAPAD